MSRFIINPYLFASGGGSPIIEFFAEIPSSTGASVTLPASIISGDLIVVTSHCQGDDGPPNVNTIPSGYTRIGPGLTTAGGAGSRHLVYYKMSAGSDSGASVNIDNTGLGGRAVGAVFRRTPAATSVTVSTSVGGQITTGNPTAQNVVASGGTPPLVVLASYMTASGAVDPRTFTPAKDGEVASSTLLYLAYKNYSSSPLDTSVDMDDEGVGPNAVISCYIQMNAGGP